jgi:UDP-3-O-acyl-N-acetylglucosamine deacetylase
VTYQKTVRKKFEIEGATLWSRGYVKVSVHPARPDTGIVIRRTDFKRPVSFRPSIENALLDRHRVVLCSGHRKIFFVEHLLAGLWGMGVDNASVEIDGPELPFFDGSSLEYVRGVNEVGMVEHKVPRRIIRPGGSLTLVSRGRVIYIRPAPRWGISYLFRHRGLRFESFSDVEAVFASSIAPARTFAVGNYPDFDYPFQVRTRGRLSFPYPTRFADEMLRHKVLDMVGDIALLGRRPAAHIWTWRAGHRQNHQVVELLSKENKDGES